MLPWLVQTVKTKSSTTTTKTVTVSEEPVSSSLRWHYPLQSTNPNSLLAEIKYQWNNWHLNSTLDIRIIYTNGKKCQCQDYTSMCESCLVHLCDHPRENTGGSAWQLLSSSRPTAAHKGSFISQSEPSLPKGPDEPRQEVLQEAPWSPAGPATPGKPTQLHWTWHCTGPDCPRFPSGCQIST